jgi:hypothetical protein
MPAKAGTQGLPALNASLDSRLRGSDDRAVGVACIFANLRNEVLGGFTSSYRRRRSRRARQRQKWVVPQSSCLLIDTTAAAHLPGPQNLRECHLYFAEGCHLYIALTVNVHANYKCQ